MAKKKTTTRRRSEAGAHKADPTGLDDSVRSEDAQKDDAADSRADHMKKVAAADKAHKDGQKVKSYYYEIVGGKKLIKKVRKANGSVHSFYIGNCEKDGTLLQNEDVKKHLKK